jgi:hypothetical protein
MRKAKTDPLKFETLENTDSKLVIVDKIGKNTLYATIGNNQPHAICLTNA